MASSVSADPWFTFRTDTLTHTSTARSYGGNRHADKAEVIFDFTNGRQKEHIYMR